MSISEELVRWFSILLAGITFSITLNTDQHLSSNYLLINQGLFITLIGYLLLPIPKNPYRLLTNIAAVVLLFIILTQFTATRMVPMQILFRLCLVIFCLSLFLWSLSQLAKALFSNALRIRMPILLLTASVCSAPVWLGPLVDLYLPYNSIINSIISITPLTHISVAAEYDYLRSEWFYRNTPFGSLPFTYPDLITVISSYLVLVIFLQAILWKITRKNTPLIQSQEHSFDIS